MDSVPRYHRSLIMATFSCRLPDSLPRQPPGVPLFPEAKGDRPPAPSTPLWLLHELQARIVPDVGELLTQVGKWGQPVPGGKEMIGGGADEPGGLDHFEPIGTADLL